MSAAGYDLTQDSMDALEAMDDIMDGSELNAKAFGAMFPVFSMFVRIQGLVIQSLAAALAVAFVVMLLSINVWVALMIGAIVVMVDADLLAAIYFFNNNLAPFTFAAVSSAPPLRRIAPLDLDLPLTVAALVAALILQRLRRHAPLDLPLTRRHCSGHMAPGGDLSRAVPGLLDPRRAGVSPLPEEDGRRPRDGGGTKFSLKFTIFWGIFWHT